MRRSICFAEPTTALAGERGTWRFVVTATVSLPKGTLLKFDLASRGRVIDWQIPNAAGRSNVIWAEVEGSKTPFPRSTGLRPQESDSAI